MASDIPHIPQEMYDKIIGHLFDDQAALRACALACHAFRIPSQQQLYSDITLVTNQHISPMFRSRIRATRYLSTRRFSAILKLAPLLGTYVRSLCLYNAYVERSSVFEARMQNRLDIVGLSDCLSYIGHLQRLVVDTDTSTFTDITPDRYAYHEMISRFCFVLSLPSIVSLEIQTLHYTLLDVFNTSRNRNRKCSPAKLQLNIHSKHPSYAECVGTFFRQSIDLQKLEHLALSHSYDVMQYQDIFRDILSTCGRCPLLTQLDIEIWGNSEAEGSTIADLGLFTGIEKLSIMQRHRYGLPRSTNTVPQLLNILKSMRPANTNRLEVLKIGVQYNRAFYEPAIHSTSWVELWTYVSQLDRFPCLKRTEMDLVGADAVCEEIFKDLEIQLSLQPHFLNTIDLHTKKAW